MGPMANDIDDTKDKEVKIRISFADHAAWSAAAKADNRKLSDWIRLRCNGQPTTAPKGRK